MSDDETAETVRDGVARRAPQTDHADHARYRPVREIARGGMGRVLEAFDQRLSRTVALKEILDEHPEARARFEREVEITARLEHPSIVPLYDAGTSDDGAPFYVMRRVAGEPLDTLIRNATSLDQRLRLLPHVLALADAVAHAHARGVIHRDLKPTNVLVGELGETVVIDWGLAKLIGESDTPLPERAGSLHTRAGTVFGTPGFMSPEQVAGDSVDERADVYALGGCLYHVLAGRRPPEGDIDFAIDGAPTELVTIASKAMAADKAARYLDAGGFSEDLRRFLGGRLVAAHHYPLHARIGRWLRRHRALVAVVALALAISIGGGVLALRRIFAEQARAEDALAREVARTDDLLIYKASTYLDTDPTLAAASLQQLREESPRWDTLGPMIAAIRARGVAFAYPGPGSGARSISMAPGRNDLLLVATAGEVRLIDLATRATRTLSADPAIRSARWIGDRVGVSYLGQRPMDLIDVATGRAAPAPWPSDLTSSTVTADGTLIGIGADRKGFVLAPNGKPVPIDITGPADLEVSPSGRWLGVTTRTGYELWRATASGYERVIAGEQTNAIIDFDGDRRAVIGSPKEIVEYDLATAAQVGRWDTPAPGIPRYIAGTVHWWSAGQVQRISEGMPATRGYGRLPEVTTGARFARLIDDRQIEVIDDIAYALRAPEPVDMLLGKPGSPYLVAAGPSHLFVWDLREITAKTSTTPPIDEILFGGAATVVGIAGISRFAVRQFELSDLALRERSLDELPPDARLYAFPGAVLAIDSGRGRILSPARSAIDVADLRALHVYGDALIGGTGTGAIVKIDRTTGHAVETIGNTGFPIVGVGARDGWILADSEAGQLWRRDPTGGITTAQIANWLSPSITSDGTVFVGRDRELLMWEPAGAPTVVAKFPEQLAVPAFLKVTARYLIAATQHGLIIKYDRATRTTRTLIGAVRAIAVAADAEVAAVAVDGALVILDLDTGDRYRLVDRISVTPNGVAMSPDGTTVLAVTDSGEHRATVSAWRLTAGSRAWLSQATNAIPPPVAGGAIDYR